MCDRMCLYVRVRHPSSIEYAYANEQYANQHYFMHLNIGMLYR